MTNTTMKLRCCVLLFVLFHLSPASASAVKFEHFRKLSPNDLPPGLPTSGDLKFTPAGSDLDCARASLDAAAPNFLYDAGSGTCAHATSPADLAALPETSDGALYSKCDPGLGFRYYHHAGRFACYALYQKEMNYTDALSYCTERGAYLVTVKDIDQVNLLLESLSDWVDFWVGLNDLEVEGVYVWERDGTVAFSSVDGVHPSDTAKIAMPGMWSYGQPNNYLNQDCIHIDDRTQTFHDDLCSRRIQVVCEI